MNNSKIAFTLAEVLITLGVIGVVAALTMPTLIQNHQISSWESALKKSYSTITNGFHMIAAESGGDLRNSGLFDDIDDSVFSDRMDKAVKEYFKITKTCKINDTSCLGYNNNNLKGTYLEGKYNYFQTNSTQYKNFVAYLANGVIIAISNQKCEPTEYQNESNFKYNCGIIYIDINGEKKPNIRGKDIFQLGSIDEKGNIYPHTSLEWAKAKYGANNALNGEYYWRNKPSQCGTPSKKINEETETFIHGQNCLARIMENSWKMDYLK